MINIFQKVAEFISPRSFSHEFRQKKKTAAILIAESRDSADYYVMLVVAILIITFGLIENNTAIIIGGMLVSPVLYPILALGLGAAAGRLDLFLRSLRILIASTILILAISSAVSYVFAPDAYMNYEIETSLSYSVISVLVAFFAGFAGAYAWASETLHVNLAGIAIAVALLPPLCVTGIQLAHNNMEAVQKSFTLFSINVGGIFFASFLIFFFFNYREVKGIVEKTVKDEVEENE
ncbi:MAG: TIGR00341 family protein [Candidatus Peregrinibacteria bacterium]|nr:TIGR00341 family protein [Candidatus Peregrinibacteria bacterium]MDZ4245265.1 TIGR00341 family protein [Candidatus Gracilibacteria bacterium]